MAEREPDEALLAAYVDGVGELTPEERRRVEDRLGELDVAGTRQVIEQLRALPPEGNEPDWRTLERRIAGAVDHVRTPWWRRWFVPAGALVLSAAAVMLWLHHAPARAPVAPPVVAKLVPPAPPVLDAAVPQPPAQATEVWLDGQLVDVTGVDPDAVFDDGDATDTMTADDDGLLPTLHWVDDLDDRALDRAEHILEKKKS